MGAQATSEIPLLFIVILLIPLCRDSALQGYSGFKAQHLLRDLCGRHSQVGSLAGAAHLLNDNAGVLR